MTAYNAPIGYNTPIPYNGGTIPPIPPPTPDLDVPGLGYTFSLIGPGGTTQQIHPSLSGSIEQDLGRPVRRTFTGSTFLPDEYAKFTDLSKDRLDLTVSIEGVDYPIGSFYASEVNYQPSQVLDEAGNPANLYHIDFGDGFLLLRRSSEVPKSLNAGADPSQEMIKLIAETGLSESIAGATSNLLTSVSWPPGTTYEEIVSQLATVAGHRSPWADNYGVIRSIAAGVVETDVIDFMSLGPEAGSILISENYLSAPNRIVVYDSSAPFPTVGTWNAPASAPHSEARRGYVLTAVVEQQGISGPIHAQQIAATLGESLTARTLAANIMPTAALDGPKVLSYLDTLWLCQNWSLSLEDGAMMQISATELIIP